MHVIEIAGRSERPFPPPGATQGRQTAGISPIPDLQICRLPTLMYRYLHTSIICISQRMHGDAASILTFSSLLMTLLTCALPSTMPREASSSEQTTSSLTALALAPGVLNTGMPSSVILGTGMLLVPAPQRTMQRTVGATSSGLRVCERSMMAMGDEGSWLSSPATAYLPDGKRLSPTGLMALNVLTVKAAPA